MLSIWEENESVEALKELCPLTVKMSMFGGFEQVGQIVVFYGSNSWAYMRLGHIDMTQEELTELLGNGDVEITLE